jgi:hypothetical protein
VKQSSMLSIMCGICHMLNELVTIYTNECAMTGLTLKQVCLHTRQLQTTGLYVTPLGRDNV